MADPSIRRANWPLWTGFLVGLVAFFSYFFFFVQFPVTRNFPWANLLLFAVAAGLLTLGLHYAFRRADVYQGKILGPVLTGLSVLIFGAFVALVFFVARQLPASAHAPQVGTQAPEFTLLDTDKKLVSLAELRSAPIHGLPARGVLLIFYRGYW
jgi:hypothetical protein